MCQTTIPYLSFGITEYDCLCDGECIVEITECVKLPFLIFLLVLQNMTACVMVSVIRDHRVCQTSIPTFLLVLQNMTACVMVSVS